MDLTIDKTGLSKYFDKAEFVQKTIAQIEKDLDGLCKLQVEFTSTKEDDVLDHIMVQLSEVLKQMSSRNLQQFIYRVDLQEGQYLEALRKEDELVELSYMVIRREALKVYLRTQF
ncbi:hypothetical protein K6119_13940 [Paracrocinitomix mangrovi]|uniref:hypothetical protein n=1 Tax=Paracrocinitomix mangrovi TaxID=2862509 RepID=UPI001C8D09B0|nr:hypothetical protein [Paracrocinitomix mangrovi]UKN00831.1 hypothetical protein K6119_13940 [Paracrocinitomix mangrovi]